MKKHALFALYFVQHLTSHIGDFVKKSYPDPNDPVLKSAYAPHETGAVLRAHRAGRSAAWIGKEMKMRPGQIMAAIRDQLEAENAASRKNLPIHDGLVKPGTQ
ncbi:hypothetical protein FDI09_gp32 [Mycobacterium phage Twister]|uniref:Gp68-like predicted RNA polymerase component domain-containing protein n=2 Tax=Fromanvirus twister TaxID=1993863 RepID=H9NCN5_9CAUD|nr:hypothetical protein FDI09_gp32 [Mycobacterium phage Twister]AFF28356.1 hypothetical protein TWISTER_63 [Mycobacterium phage Twister]QGJ94738.1 hypothetical protein SEA_WALTERMCMICKEY_63 [Mycobacterium phage WalterMcMickey]QLF84456.1 hypothetical protein SEA_TOPANGA_61 [Mycobacterium phage Topanga]